MNKLALFVKNLGISKEEKLMRKHGLKNEYGEYSVQAKEIIINMICKEKNAELLTIAESLEAEEVADKKKD